jgi:hypothetical protein
MNNGSLFCEAGYLRGQESWSNAKRHDKGTHALRTGLSAFCWVLGAGS